MSFFLLQMSYFLIKWFITSALLLTSSSISISCLQPTAEHWGSSWSGESVSAWCLGWVWTCSSGASSESENRGLAVYRCVQEEDKELACYVWAHKWCNKRICESASLTIRQQNTIVVLNTWVVVSTLWSHYNIRTILLTAMIRAD